jgi:hydroxymethylpyrimidine/phosphomethylpyrimidine kinase
MTARILIIAGSDSGGGAGIQADIKTVTMLGGHAMTAITAITAQNTLGVSDIHPIPTTSVIAQMDAVISDIGVDAVKIGMIGSAETANAVADRLAGVNVPIVFDPVMIATSGAALADAATIAAFNRLMALASLTTPNLPELAALGGEDAVGAATKAVLIKGGHGPDRMITDRLLVGSREVARWQGERIETTSTHGTGCTLASAIACGLGQGLALEPAIARARCFVRLALRDAPGLGAGHGPMGHQAVRMDADGAMRLNQITVGLADYATSLAFYQALGLKLIVDSPPNYARFEAPGGITLSIHRDDNHPNPGGTVYFECDDLDDEVARLETAGLVFDQGIVEQDWLWREAHLRDPFGNRIILYHAGEMRRYPPWRVG